MKHRILVALLLASPAVLFAAPSQRYLVVTHHPFANAVHSLPFEDFGPGPHAAMRVRRFQAVDGFAADLTAEQLQRLESSPEVKWIEPVIERHALDDSIIPGQQIIPYGIAMVNAPQLWHASQGRALNGSGPTHVAVIDTGIDYNSPELRGAYKGGMNLVSGTNDPLDDNGHGTHVSGIIAAADDNEGVVGVAPQVDLYVVKVLDACGSGSSENIIAAVDWVIQKKTAIGGNWVANLSLGSDQPSTTEQAAFQNGTNAGILFFAAAGNNYDTNPVDGLAFPAGYPMVISVGAIDSTQTIASFSQRGPDLKVVAPGVNVLSTIVAAEVTTNDGHRFAGTTPVVVQDSSGTPLDGFCLPAPKISGQFIFCNFGATAADFPSSVKGNIALIQRGPITNGVTFVTKILNAQTAGAAGVIIFDHTDEPLLVPALGNYTTVGSVPNFPPTVFIGLNDGKTLQGDSTATASLSFGLETWQLDSGTSMSTPHATAVAALVWSFAPTAAAADVTNAIETTATSLGDPNTYGHGLVNAFAAAKLLNPCVFGGTPAQCPAVGRDFGRRGH